MKPGAQEETHHRSLYAIFRSKHWCEKYQKIQIFMSCLSIIFQDIPIICKWYLDDTVDKQNLASHLIQNCISHSWHLITVVRHSKKLVQDFIHQPCLVIFPRYPGIFNPNVTQSKHAILYVYIRIYVIYIYISYIYIIITYSMNFNDELWGSGNIFLKLSNCKSYPSPHQTKSWILITGDGSKSKIPQSPTEKHLPSVAHELWARKSLQLKGCFGKLCKELFCLDMPDMPDMRWISIPFPYSKHTSSHPSRTSDTVFMSLHFAIWLTSQAELNLMQTFPNPPKRGLMNRSHLLVILSWYHGFHGYPWLSMAIRAYPWLSHCYGPNFHSEIAKWRLRWPVSQGC